MAGRMYPPRDDAGILEKADLLESHSAGLLAAGFTAADITRLTGANSDAKTAVADNTAKQQAARAARVDKDDKVDLLEDILGEFNRRAQPLTTVSDGEKSKWGLPVYDKTPTKADAPGELPNIRIDTGTPLRHEIRFSGDNSKGKPEGVEKLLILVKIDGEATGSEEDYQYQGEDSEPPYIKSFAAKDAGKQAHYLFCWVNASGERGPWRMVSATITSELQ